MGSLSQPSLCATRTTPPRPPPPRSSESSYSCRTRMRCSSRADSTSRTMASSTAPAEPWRGNLANVIRYFPTQALNFAFKDSIKAMFSVAKDASQVTKFSVNIASGGCAGSLSLLFVYSLDYARTRMANDAKTKGGERQFNGLIDGYKKTIAADGV